MLSFAEMNAADAKQRLMTTRLEPAAIYKKMVVALRSLYSYMRVLPAYRLYRACAVGLTPLRHAFYCINNPFPYHHHLCNVTGLYRSDFHAC